MERLVQQIAKFGVVGILATLLDYGLLFVLTEWAGLYYLLSSMLSFGISTVFNYAASVRWVFAVKKEYSKTRNFVLFVIFSLLGLSLNALAMWVGVECLHWHYMIVKIGATAIVMVFNFITRKKVLEQ